MPNWVKNMVKVDGRFDEIKDFVRSEEQEFDFEKINPMPECYQGLTAGGHEDEEIVYFLSKGFTLSLEEMRKEFFPILKLMVNNMFNKNYDAMCYESMNKRVSEMDEASRKHAFINGCRYVDNFIRYGAKDWYEWCIENWGTKWNCNFYRYHENSFEFDTAWSTPIGVLKALSEKFPDVTISVDYADEDLGVNCGSYAFKNGQLLYDHRYNENLWFACEVWGYDYEEELEFRNQA